MLAFHVMQVMKYSKYDDHFWLNVEDMLHHFHDNLQIQKQVFIKLNLHLVLTQASFDLILAQNRLPKVVIFDIKNLISCYSVGAREFYLLLNRFYL